LAKEIKLVLKDFGIHLRAVYRQCAVSYTDFCPFLWDSFSSNKI